MRTVPIQIIILLLVLTSLAVAADTPADHRQAQSFIELIEADTVRARSIGLHKLTPSEKEQLNAILNDAYRMGYARCVSVNYDRAEGKAVDEDSAGVAYLTAFKSSAGNVLELENGIIVRVTQGQLGDLGRSRQVAVYKHLRKWYVWIERKRAFECEIVKMPDDLVGSPACIAFISDIEKEGGVLIMHDGIMYQVAMQDALTVKGWLGASKVLIIDGYQVINLEEGGELIKVIRFR